MMTSHAHFHKGSYPAYQSRLHSGCEKISDSARRHSLGLETNANYTPSHHVLFT